MKLSLWCAGCLPGYQLPFHSAVVSGLFTDYDLIVEILSPPPPPGTSNPRRVVEGEADFALTAVSYFLLAGKEVGDSFAARFVNIVHQHNPFGVVVLDDSEVKAPADTAGRRLARSEFNAWAIEECRTAMDDLGIPAPALVDVDHYDFHGALARREIDMKACFTDTLAVARHTVGLPVRRVEFGLDIYGSGLVAADHLPLELVDRMRLAVGAAFEEQRVNSDDYVAEFCERFPRRDPSVVREGWELLEPYAFSAGEVGLMDRDRWTRSVDWYERAHGFPPVAADRVYRPELLAPAGTYCL